MLRIPKLRRFCASCRSSGFTGYRDLRLETHYGHLDLRTRRLRWTVKLGGKHVRAAGVDPRGRKLMTYTIHGGKRGGAHTQKVRFKRLDLRTRRFDWRHVVKLPPRRTRSGRLGSARVHVSLDLTRIFVNEYDERNRRHPQGYLHSPPARGVIVDVTRSSQVTFHAPVTAYGRVFDARGRYLYLTSYQRGRIYQVDTHTGRVLNQVSRGYGAFALFFSRTERYLYCVHHRGVDVFDPATLKRVATIPLDRLFPGHHQLLSVVTVHALRSGHFLMPILTRAGRSGRSTSRSFAGFVHFRILE